MDPVHVVNVRGGALHLADWRGGLGRVLRAEGAYPLASADVPGQPLLDAHGRPLATLPDAERAVLESVPEEIRCLAAPCGRFQWIALEAMRHVPGFSDFLRQEAAGAGHGFVLACWAVSGARVRGRIERLAMAARAMVEPRARTLADLAGLAEIDVAVVRLLARVSAEEVDYPLVVALARLCGEPIARRALWESPRLSAAGVRALLVLPPWLMCPAVARAVAVGATEERLRPVALALADLDGAERARVFRMLKGVADWAEMERRLREGAARIRRARPFPPPPIPGDDLLRPIRSGDDLAREGREMSHCVADYAAEVRSGFRYYYRWLGAERATVELSLAGADGWRITEALAWRNADIARATRDEIARRVASQTIAPSLFLETSIAGGGYYDAAEVLLRLEMGAPVCLRREPGNPHDALAVEVLTESGAKLGYLPRTVNRAPAELMDRGGRLRGAVIRAASIHDIRIRVRAEEGENKA